MPLPIEILEAFFESKFQREQRAAQLIHFDGFAYWHLLWMPHDSQFLKIVACDSPVVCPAYPTVEVEGRYSDDISVYPLSGGIAVALTLRPEGSDKATEAMNHVIITKTKDGRFSLSTTVGKQAAT